MISLFYLSPIVKSFFCFLAVVTIFFFLYIIVLQICSLCKSDGTKQYLYALFCGKETFLIRYAPSGLMIALSFYLPWWWEQVEPLANLVPVFWMYLWSNYIFTRNLSSSFECLQKTDASVNLSAVFYEKKITLCSFFYIFQILLVLYIYNRSQLTQGRKVLSGLDMLSKLVRRVRMGDVIINYCLWYLDDLLLKILLFLFARCSFYVSNLY